MSIFGQRRKGSFFLGSKKSGLAASFLGGAGVSLLQGRTYVGGPRGVLANYLNKNLVFHYKYHLPLMFDQNLNYFLNKKDNKK